MIEHGDKIIAEAQLPRTLIVSPRCSRDLWRFYPQPFKKPSNPFLFEVGHIIAPSALPSIPFFAQIIQTDSLLCFDRHIHMLFFFELICTFFFFFSSELTIGSVIQSFFLFGLRDSKTLAI